MADRVSVMSWLEGLAQDDWRQYHSDSEVQEIARSALALLEEQEPVSAVAIGGWISVKDRLPDGKDCYLAYNRYGWDIMAYDPNEGVWLSMGHRVADGEITHWMPLPAEPPEEVSKDADKGL